MNEIEETEELSSVDIVFEEMLQDTVLKLLKINGYSPEDNPIEYDRSRDDSQYSLYEDSILEMLDVMNATNITCLDCDAPDLLIPMHSCTLELDDITPNKEQ